MSYDEPWPYGRMLSPAWWHNNHGACPMCRACVELNCPRRQLQTAPIYYNAPAAVAPDKRSRQRVMFETGIPAATRVFVERRVGRQDHHRGSRVR